MTYSLYITPKNSQNTPQENESRMLSIVSGPFDECKDPLECAEKRSLGTIRANKYLSIYLSIPL